MKMHTLQDAPVRALLHSPLRGVISKHTLEITYEGRKTGNLYTVPVNYVRDGDTLLITSPRTRVWWRNLVGGVPVKVRVEGQTLYGEAEAYEDATTVRDGLLRMLREMPRLQKAVGVTLRSDGEAEDEAALLRAVSTYVIVRVHDLES